ncbi:TIGR03503 family protein [Vibrio astriarenae]|uniref:TIGR03503 family protein n=1 Tax=Vibrio astriarenae TaxID=1481923 RepID=A0A7Z2T471_9VIBR|nr:TIGR03503 family protein [Vibrio astriarenae]QIA63955.1 TIGR03503 family protein [Vibrio astriarenae]
MKAVLVTLWLLVFSAFSYASQESSVSLLDNRFRVDPSIEQITFVIYRAERSQPVVLVRPDGKKYYAWKNEDNVRWYQESAMDIVSIDNPMPGPWQAVGKVTPKNKILLISHLELRADTLPSRLYQGEEIKFTAELTSNGEPLVVRDFLDRVNLRVTFTKYVENEAELSAQARPIPEIVGEFADDGKGLDEVAGDGKFTVALPIAPEPGKYRVRITSGNGVFLRAIEQEVLVYPSPVSIQFAQSREPGTAHHLTISGESGLIAPGSLAAKVDHTNPEELVDHIEGAASEEQTSIALNIPYQGTLGNYSWQTTVFATDQASQRSLQFSFPNRSYSVAEHVNLEETKRLQELERQAELKRQQEQYLMEHRARARKKAVIWIVVGNLSVIVLGLVIWFVWRQRKAKKAELPEMQLELPK